MHVLDVFQIILCPDKDSGCVACGVAATQDFLFGRVDTQTHILLQTLKITTPDEWIDILMLLQQWKLTGGRLFKLFLLLIQLFQNCPTPYLHLNNTQTFVCPIIALGNSLLN